MRGVVVAVLLLLSACNQLLGLDDPPSCSVTTACGDFAYCDLVETQACRCVPAYTFDGSACVPGNVVEDPTFQDPGAWTVHEHAFVRDGVAVLPPDCGAALSQTVRMPAFDPTRALVAHVRARFPTRPPDELSVPLGLEFGINGVWTDVPMPDLASPDTVMKVCVGGGSYAREGVAASFTLTLGRMEHEHCQPEIEIHEFSIVPAAASECIAPGTVLNGNADTATGWALSSSNNPQIPDASSAMFVATGGENNSPSLQLTLDRRCSYAQAEIPIAVGARSTLSFWTAQPALALLYSALGRSMVALDAPSTTPQVQRCVPAAMRTSYGSVVIGFEAIDEQGAQVCADLNTNRVARLDSVALTDALACGSDPAIADPSFDSMQPPAASYAEGAAAVRITAAGYQGPGLELSVGGCGAAAASLDVVAPLPDGNNGPAVQLWHQGALAGVDLFAGPITRPLTTTAVEPTGAWRQATICLDPRLAGRRQIVDLFLDPAEGVDCDSSTATLVIDELSVTTSSACRP